MGIVLTDEQLAIVDTAARALEPQDRAAFAQALAAVLRDAPRPIGDGELARALRLTWRGFWHPPPVYKLPAQSRRRVGAALR